MSSDVEEYVIYQIANAPMREYPYRHFYVEKAFPDEFYAALRANWPDPSTMVSISDTGFVTKDSCRERLVLQVRKSGIDKMSEDRRAFWNEFSSWFNSERFMLAIIKKFERDVNLRFSVPLYRNNFRVNSMVVHDLTNYSLGPHTDSPARLLSLLFYCPDDDSRKHLGTSIYVPLDPDDRCKGGPHYRYELFRKVMTMDYKPNSLFAFFKTDSSFHGVEPISDQNVQRDLLSYDILVTEPPVQNPPTKTTSLGIRMLKRLFGGRL